MSGNTRVGLSSTRFRPGEWYFSESASGMSAPTPNWRKIAPLVLVLLTSAVPAVLPPLMPARSFCSHM